MRETLRRKRGRAQRDDLGIIADKIRPWHQEIHIAPMRRDSSTHSCVRPDDRFLVALFRFGKIGKRFGLLREKCETLHHAHGICGQIGEQRREGISSRN